MTDKSFGWEDELDKKSNHLCLKCGRPYHRYDSLRCLLSHIKTLENGVAELRAQQIAMDTPKMKQWQSLHEARLEAKLLKERVEALQAHNAALEMLLKTAAAYLKPLAEKADEYTGSGFNEGTKLWIGFGLGRLERVKSLLLRLKRLDLTFGRESYGGVFCYDPEGE